MYELSSNIFLHYLNKDTQEIFGIADTKDIIIMNRLRRGLNASILLCKEYCFMPLGFYFECENTRELILQNLELIEEGLLRFCMRESELGEYVEKKQGQLKKFANDISSYQSFFDNKYAKQLQKIMPLYLSRNIKVGEYCVDKWVKQHRLFWDNKEGDMYNAYFRINDIQDIFRITSGIQNAAIETKDGAFVWKIIDEKYKDLNIKDKTLYQKLRMYFEKYYYEAYLIEYQASILYDFFLIDRGCDFTLKSEYETIINYSWFYAFLECLGLKECLDLQARKIVKLKNLPQFVALFDIYVNICSKKEFKKDASSIRSLVTNMILKNQKGINDLAKKLKEFIRQPVIDTFFMDSLRFNEIDDKEKQKTVNRGDSVIQQEESAMKDNRKVFIVHGHDESAKEMVARFLEQFDFEAIILHEQADGGKTIIEKIECYTDVVFAIILYTPCDIGHAKEDKRGKPRARQNVVFEHGYLIGKLGRERVCALVKEKVETPGDISGVVYKQMDPAGAWKTEILREMKNAGIAVNADKLL